MTFSIVIPVYNVAPYLRECLDSVFAAASTLSEKRGVSSEKCRGVEIICVDDGSSDGSGEILDECWREKIGVGNRCTAERDQIVNSSTSTRNIDFKIIHQKNAGVSAARNAALDVATGEWVLFVDADDVVSRDWLTAIAAQLEGMNSVALVAFDKIEFEDGKFVESLQLLTPAPFITIPISLCHEIPALMGQLALYQFAYPRVLIEGLHFQPYTVGEDLLFVASALARAQSVRFIRKPLYAYRHRPGSAMQSAVSPRKLRDGMRYVPEMLQVLSQSGKRIDRIFSRTRANGWIEGVPSSALAMSDVGERRAIMREWRTTLAEASSIGCLSLFNRLRAAVNRRLPLNCVAWATCVLPHAMKVRRVKLP